MTYTENDILQAVGHNAFTAGKSYHRQGRVIAFQWEGDGGIAAQVQGSERKPYRLSISIEANHKGRMTIEGDCSCPVAYNCKHVAAGLLHGLTSDKATIGIDADSFDTAQDCAAIPGRASNISWTSRSSPDAAVTVGSRCRLGESFA